ncbi:MAG TPA: transglycosylase domain-containing protein [Gemmatimonadota bacterium]|nr:transglycosylase domain-containing protein [Gemmatimonadota bacterium]
MLERTAVLVGLIGEAFLLGVLGWMGWLWWRTPGIVHRAEEEVVEPLDADDLPAGRIEDLLAVEDPGFFDHRGIDVSTPGAGWTTITQGLAKDLYFDAFRPGPLAKLEQSLAALVLDARIPKERQLALFLGGAYLGESDEGAVNGFGPAARAWLGKDVRELDRREFLSLVAMAIGPNEYGISSRPAQNAERVARIERLLAGRCRPSGWRDVTYERCATGRPASAPAAGGS